MAAMLPGKGQHADEYVVIGAHYDHLGRGGPGSLAPCRTAIHHGADDNAAGTAAMLDIGRPLRPRRPAAAVAGLRRLHRRGGGADRVEHFVSHPPVPLDKIVAMLNLDMVGRVRDEKLSVGGAGTAAELREVREGRGRGLAAEAPELRRRAALGPSDHMSFAMKKIPVLFFFSGLHADYHRPTDTADKVNYEGMRQVVDLSREGRRGDDEDAPRAVRRHVRLRRDAWAMGTGTGSASGGSQGDARRRPRLRRRRRASTASASAAPPPAPPPTRPGSRPATCIVKFDGQNLDSLHGPVHRPEQEPSPATRST